MPELYIYEDKKPEMKVLVWPNRVETLPNGLIQETRSYIFEAIGVDDASVVDLYIDEEKLEALRPPNPSTALWRWSTGFYAGQVSIVIQLGPGNKHSFDLITDPDIHKLSRSDFDLMVREILEDTYSLFSLSGFTVSIAKGTGKDLPPIARLEFIRSRIDAIESVVNAINNRPVRFLGANQSVIPYHKAKTLTSPEIIRSFRHGNVLKSTSDSTELLTSLKGFIPANIRKSTNKIVYDIREHRAIKSSIKAWIAWLNVIADRLGGLLIEDSEVNKYKIYWSKRCRQMSNRLNHLLRLPLFLEVPDQTMPIELTPIFRNVDAYRKFFNLNREMNLGISNIVGDFLQIPIARTFELYELWCFFRIIRAFSTTSGIEDFLNTESLMNYDRDTGSLYINPKAAIIPIGANLVISFQRTYKEYWFESDGRGSFSRPMRPDLSIQVNDGDKKVKGKLIILDAKYRINDQLNSAISSIHMYRDALVEPDEETNVRHIVCGAYLLTPHSPGLSNQPWQDIRLPGRLFHPEYRGNFKFGAITLRPGMSLQDVKSVIDTILDDVKN